MQVSDASRSPGSYEPLETASARRGGFSEEGRVLRDKRVVLGLRAKAICWGSGFMAVYLLFGGAVLRLDYACESGLPIPLYAAGVATALSAVAVERTLLPHSRVDQVAMLGSAFTFADHWDQFSDMAAIGIAKACDANVTTGLLHSFDHADLDTLENVTGVPHLKSKVQAFIGTHRVWRIMVMIYLCWVFIPQFVFMNAWGTTSCSIVLMICLRFNLAPLALLALVSPLSCLIQLIRGLGYIPTGHEMVMGYQELYACSLLALGHMASRAGFEALSQSAGNALKEHFAREPEAQNEYERRENAIQVACQPLTRAIFENVVQLYLQIDILQFSYGSLGPLAKAQFFASLALTSVSSARKVYLVWTDAWHLWTKGTSSSKNSKCAILVLLPSLIMLPIVEVSLRRLIGIFRCESHVWNLTTGCVSP